MTAHGGGGEGGASARPSGTALARAHRVVPDRLYHAIPVSQWAHALIESAPFRRLSDVSLSDIPGSFLFGGAFPSRLSHCLGVYYLARQARPRDRALQAAALAHDLGHGPFSHLSEPLMLERLGMDHEQRSTELLRALISQARGQAGRLLAWLDLDEVCAMITGDGREARGELLNGRLDYDNLDHVARFMQAAGLGAPAYDGRMLARGLRIVVDGRGFERVALQDDLWQQARSWQTDRAVVFQFLQSDPWNGAAYGMLRKAMDLAARAGEIGDGFFDLTDGGALEYLRAGAASQGLVERVIAHDPYGVIWEADAPQDAREIERIFSSWRLRVALEERIAGEAGLRSSDLIATYVVSRVERPLPPLVAQVARGQAELMRELPAPERFLRILTPREIGRDYARRARMASERILGALGAVTRGWPQLR